MNVVIDIGNSSVKTAIFDRDRCRETVITDDSRQTQSALAQLLQLYRPEYGILSSVKTPDCNILRLLSAQIPHFYELNYRIPLPLQINYQTPETLGVDRIAAAVGASCLHPGRNLLVIDIGTAITIDFVSADGKYKGGNISPGPALRFKALHQFTDKLPEVAENGDFPPLGSDTESAIRAGVIHGIARELDSYIEEYQKNANVLSLLTGGYAEYFVNKLKNTTFVAENLVLTGLNEILNYQK
ncbi:MAG: type III pantothenate kinase [Candidatus Symbiothrix sp.]|jgi:type III pantothenate kinase|nr:type III pantothenate kinase [Candidatus Symbiothrix sp.]